MRVFHVGGGLNELPALPDGLPADGFVWIGLARRDFETHLQTLQGRLKHWGCGAIVELHVSDLLNEQLPSHFDYTSWYDVMVFRRLAALPAPADDALDAVDTSPVGFVVFDRVLITVHNHECAVRDYFAQRLASAGARLPTSPADLMLRMVNHMVDSYLDLRRMLSRRFEELEQSLFDPKSRFDDWPRLLVARNRLHLLEDTCEDQRAAVQEWLDGLDEQPAAEDPRAARDRELLRIRSRDVQEHIERVLTHVRRLQSSAETAVQMHFSALGNRTNEIMRTLTVLTAVFLPLNLITGFFGMNFEFLPLIHSSRGFWIAFVTMVTVGGGLAWFFWRKRYLGRARR